MGPKKCQVCDKATSKYKCPTCLIPYCSLVCFKKHKEIPCVKPISPSDTISTSASVSHVERPFHVDEPSEVLQQMQLESIASSSEIRDALKDDELQKLICNIDCSPNAENELDRAMQVDVFRKFADKILTLVHRDGLL